MKAGKKRILIILCAVIAGILILGKLVMSDISVMEKWGIIQSGQSKQSSDQIYAVGKNGKVLQSEYDRVKQFYMISGIKERQAKKQAKDYILKREALYQAALREGYTVTDEEVEVYLVNLKQFISEADNKEDVQKVIDQFDSEEDYWKYEFEIYKKDLPIQKYIEAKEQEFQKMKEEDKADGEKNWQEQFEQLKNQLLKEEKFEIVKQ